MRQARGRQGGLFLSTGVALLLLALLTSAVPLGAPEGLARALLSPMELGALSAEGAVGQLAQGMANGAALSRRNSELTAQNAALKAEVAGLRAAGVENRALRSELTLERTMGHKMLAADVVALGAEALDQALTLDRGSSSGLRVGMVALTGAGLVGRISAVGPNTAVVQTLADGNFRVNGYAVQSGLEGTLVGGPRGLAMSVIPVPGKVAAKGEWVFTSGIGQSFPRGIPIGRVETFQPNPEAISETATVAWSADLEALSNVLVITDFVPSYTS